MRVNKDKRAQGSLEYLIIITAVLAIAAIVVLYVTDVFGGQVSTASIAACKQSAAECKLLKMTSPDEPCNPCDTACVSSVTGEEVTEGAIECCKLGEPEMIYDGSTGCGLACLDGTLHGECSQTKPKYCENGTLVDKCSVCGCITTQPSMPLICNTSSESCYVPFRPRPFPPIASFTATPLSGLEPLDVLFNASDSRDLDGTIVSYAWEFGDGETGTGEITSHTFGAFGGGVFFKTYTTTLTVTDNDGYTNSTSLNITTIPLPPFQPF